jgi:hypothetical protein
MATPISTIHEFRTSQDARDYRYDNGTGGWIFADDAGAPVYLFPPHMPPSAIFVHPLTRGRSGKLIGSQ